jgi:hypothetical protein
MQVAAWGLGLGTAFFSFFGIRTSKDFFLMMGLVACTLGDVAFAIFLWDQEAEGGKNNDTMATLYLGLAALSVYGIYCQFQMYREEGCGLDDDDDDDEEEEGDAAAGQTNAAPAPAPAPARQIADADRGELRRRK